MLSSANRSFKMQGARLGPGALFLRRLVFGQQTLAHASRGELSVARDEKVAAQLLQMFSPPQWAEQAS